MKKTYINPEIQVVKIQAIQMLMTSKSKDEFGEGSGGTGGKTGFGVDGRGFDFFDED